MSDLVERLRIMASGVAHDGNDWDAVREAADEIDHLTKENERLESQLERFMEKGREAMIVMEASARTIDAYKAVVDAARAECLKHYHVTDARVNPAANAEAWTARQILRVLDGEP